MVVDVPTIKDELGQTLAIDDVLIARKIAAAQNHIERLLGFKIEEEFGGNGQEPIPPALIECVTLLTCHWYENREATLVGVNAQEIPLGVAEIIREFRTYTFG